MNLTRTLKLVWDFVVPVLLTAMIAAIVIVTLRVDSKFASEARLSRRAACVAVHDGNQDTYVFLRAQFDKLPDPDGSNGRFLDGLKDAYDGNLRSCLIKAEVTPRS